MKSKQLKRTRAAIDKYLAIYYPSLAGKRFSQPEKYKVTDFILRLRSFF